MFARINLCVIGIAIAICAASASGSQQAGGRGGGGQTDPWPGKKKLLLVAGVQTGDHHDAINHGMAVIERPGRETAHM